MIQHRFQKSSRFLHSCNILSLLAFESHNCRLFKQCENKPKQLSMSFLVDEDDAHATLQVALAFIDAHDIDDYTSISDSSSPLSLSSSSSSSGSPSATTTNSDSLASGGELTDFLTRTPQQAAQPKRGAERPKGNVEAVRRLRVKKKAEAVQLREQVAQLEARLNQLRSAQKTGSSLQVYLQRLQRTGDNNGLLTANNTGSGSGESENARDGDANELLVAMMTQPSHGSDNPAHWLEIAAIQAHKRVKSQALNAELKDAVSRQVKLVESIEAILANKANQYVCLWLACLGV